MNNNQTLGVFIAILALIGSFLVPEIRDLFGIERKSLPLPSAQSSLVKTAERATDQPRLQLSESPMEPLLRATPKPPTASIQQSTPRKVSLSIEQFLKMVRSGTHKYKDFLGSEVTWEAEYAGRDDQDGMVMFAIYDGKVHVVVPSDNATLQASFARLDRLAQIGKMVRVTGILQEEIIPSFNAIQATPVLVATNFSLIKTR